MDENDNREKTIYKVTWIGLGTNLILSVVKMAAGIAGRSSAMIADAVHSLSDSLTDCIVLCFVRISSKETNARYPHGHGKFETLASVIISIILFGVGIGIAAKSIQLILSVIEGDVLPRPGLVAFIAAVISIVVKETLYWYTLVVGNRLNSRVVIANAWHHRSDSLSSIGTLLGIGGAYFLGDKWRVLDPLAALIVSFLILKVALNLLVPGICELMEKSLPEEQQEEISDIIKKNREVKGLHDLKTRSIGNSIAIETHILVDSRMTVKESYTIITSIEKKLKERYGENTLITIQAEPVL